jgi:hypothetical protein
MGHSKDHTLVSFLKNHLFLWIFLMIGNSIFAQNIQDNEIVKPGKRRNQISIGYQTSYFYDPQNSIFFPIGLNAEYALGKRNLSLDLQILMYHPKTTHIDQPDYYQFLTEYFISYDLGIRFYFDRRNMQNLGFYARPSIGIGTKYYRSVTHEIQQNRGLEVTRLSGKEFLGIQFGYKGKINKFIFANVGIGTLTSFFINSDKIFILFSPNATLSLGVSF